MEETVGMAAAWRASGGGRQGQFDYEPPENCVTPVSWDIEDLSAWDKLLWEWRTTGITAEAHAMAYLREPLAARGILTAIEAQKRIGQRVTVAGLNIRPHRPPTKSGEPILFTSLEDETDFLQLTVVGEAIWSTTPVFLLHPAVIVTGVIRKQGRGSYMLVEKAKPLRMEALMGGRMVAEPPVQRTYPGTNIRVRPEVELEERVLVNV
jgi:error-prone DNA polymerase